MNLLIKKETNMRKSFYSCLFLMSLLLTGTALWSCSDDDDNGKEGPGEPDYTVNVEVDDTQTASTSAVLVCKQKVSVSMLIR